MRGNWFLKVGWYHFLIWKLKKNEAPESWHNSWLVKRLNHQLQYLRTATCIQLFTEEIRLTSWYGKYTNYLQGFIHVRWCRISSINRIKASSSLRSLIFKCLPWGIVWPQPPQRFYPPGNEHPTKQEVRKNIDSKVPLVGDILVEG